MRERLDLSSLALKGEAIPVAEQLARDSAQFGSGVGAFSVSATGVLTFRFGSNAGTQFAWFDRRGRMLETVGPSGTFQHPALSPDGPSRCLGAGCLGAGVLGASRHGARSSPLTRSRPWYYSYR